MQPDLGRRRKDNYLAADLTTPQTGGTRQEWAIGMFQFSNAAKPLIEKACFKKSEIMRQTENTVLSGSLSFALPQYGIFTH